MCNWLGLAKDGWLRTVQLAKLIPGPLSATIYVIDPPPQQHSDVAILQFDAGHFDPKIFNCRVASKIYRERFDLKQQVTLDEVMNTDSYEVEISNYIRMANSKK